MAWTSKERKGVLWKDRKQWFGNRIREQGGARTPATGGSLGSSDSKKARLGGEGIFP